MPWFSTCFSGLPDPRKGNAVRHKLLDLLAIALTTTICGAEDCVEFADFAAAREGLFREFLELPGGIPSHDTFSRLFRILDPERFAACFASFVEQLSEAGRAVLAIDGKTLRRSFDRAAAASPLHLVTAFACERRIVLGQAAVAMGEEVAGARAVLELLDLKGMLVTGDALHCKAETARLIRARGGDWLFAVKANRPGTLRDLSTLFADPGECRIEQHTTVDGGHGRIETRRHAVCHQADWLIPDRRYPKAWQMPGVQTLAKVEAEVERDGKTSLSTRYYLSSARLCAVELADAVRAHWRIENCQHWVLDVIFNEDRARTRKDHAPANLATLRRLALNLLQEAKPAISIKRKRKQAGWSDQAARDILVRMQ